jgi:hypothetical protein
MTGTEITPSVKVDTYDDMSKKLTNYFKPNRNKMFERHVFRQLKQANDETFTSFVTRLRTSAKYCDFQTVNEEIILQIITGGKHEWLTNKILSSPDLTLAQITTAALTREAVDYQSKQIAAKPDENCYYAKIDGGKYSNNNKNSNFKKDNGPKCYYCGFDKSHKTCPAKNETCLNCGKKGHFKAVCKSKPKNNLTKHESKVNATNNPIQTTYFKYIVTEISYLQ